MSWLYALLLIAAGLAGWRIYAKLVAMRAQHDDDWDEQLVKNWRAQGGNAFNSYEIDFFFGVPDQAACEQLSQALQADGCTVDFRPATSEGATGYTLHAMKLMRVSVPEMQAHSARYRNLAAPHAASYDGWATAGVTHQSESNQRLRAKGVPMSGYRRDLEKLK